MAADLLRERIGETGHVLVLGAGGGVELSVLAGECETWTFTGVDPSAEMLLRARRKVEALGAADRVSLLQGYIDDAPRQAFDAATAFLVLHYIPDDGRRLQALREIHARLRPGAPFLMINGCTDVTSPRFEEDLRLYAAAARRNGAPDEAVEGAVRLQRVSLSFVPPEREEQLLAAAGFRDVRLFYVGLWFFGWIATA
jgi:tRNA (cmo5U34)-methyltransferase